MKCQVGDLTDLKRKDYIYELKFDGTRALVKYDNGKITIFNRDEQNVSEKYPNLKFKLKCNFAILDGELVAGNNLNDIQRTEGRLKAKYMVFDILKLDDNDVKDYPLIKRKELLKGIVIENEYIELVKYFDDGLLLWEYVKKNKREGVIAKYKKSPYSYNKRSHYWKKIKVRDECVVKMDKYEINRDGSLTLTNNFHRVKCNEKSVKEIIDKNKFINIEIEFLTKTKSGHLREPVYKRIVGEI